MLTVAVILTVSWYVELRPETAAVLRHCLGVAVELAHGEGVVGDQVVARWEAVHAPGGVGGRHPLHLIHLDGHAGGLVGGQAGPVLVRSRYCAEMRNIIYNYLTSRSPHYGSCMVILAPADLVSLLYM